MEVLHRVFIFEKELKVLLLKAEQEHQGALYGLWTTDGEPVIHIIGGRNSCSRIDKRSSNLLDFVDNGFPLVHIGNWRSDDTTTPLNQKTLPQIDDLRCIHETNSSDTFLDVIIWRTTLQVSIKGRKMELQTLPAFESPFSRLERARRISIESQKEDLKQATDALKELSITGDNLATRGEILSHSVDENKQAVNMGERPHLLEDPFYLRRQEYQKEFAVNRHDFKVFMFEEDYQMMVSLVLKYPDLETGGDLFGLWTTNGDAVLHVILGPGQNCKRTGASFYQDIGYLQRNGELLTEDYMLCHIGEWHSHHQLHLFQPSGGDSSTVIRNYPRGVCGFLLIIANIVSSQRVQLSPYLYTKNSSHSYDLKGALTVVRVPNLFKSSRKIKENMDQGREIGVYLRDESQNFSGYRPSSYENRKYPSQSSVKYPFRSHEAHEGRSQRHGYSQYYRQTSGNRKSGVNLTSPHYWKRRHLADPYRGTRPVASSKYTHSVGKTNTSYRNRRTSSGYAPWKP